MSKKIISMFLVMVMLLGMAVPVMATGYDITDSVIEEETVTDADEEEIKVSLRVIGAKKGTSNPSFNQNNYIGYNYNGSEYQNWLKTQEVTVTKGTTAIEMIKYILDKEGFTHTAGTTKTFAVTAPAEFGSHNMSGNSNWYITVNKADGTFKESKVKDYKDELVEGDQVVLHYCFKADYETVNGKYADKYPDIVQGYLKIKDLTLDEMKVIDLIAAIGEVNPESKAVIEAARTAYNNLENDAAKSAISNYDVLVAAEAEYERIKDVKDEDRAQLPAPTGLSLSEANLYSVTLNATVPGVESAKYEIIYSASVDGENWGEWQPSATLEKLLPAKTYYVRAMAKTKDWALYANSEVSDAVTVKTRGDRDGEFILKEVGNREELKNALENAETDGTLTKVVLTQDIVINDLKDENYTVTIPAGANILLTGKNLYFNESGKDSYIGVSAETTVTVHDMTIASMSIAYVPGADDKGITGAAHNTFRLLDSSAVINLEDVRMYSEFSNAGVIGMGPSSKPGGTLNIYSGAYRSLDMNVFVMYYTGKMNLIPTGDILIEGGSAYNSTNPINEINLMPILGSPVSGAVLAKKNGSYTAMSEVQLQEGSYTYGYGIRINTDSSTAVTPTPITAPVVLPADDPNAENADVIYTVADDSIQLVVINRYGKENNATIQFKSSAIGKRAKSWHSFSDVVDGDASGLNSTFTYTGLKEDKEYAFEVRYASLDSNYTDAVTEVTITTSFTPVELKAPVLGDQAEKDAYSIILTAPGASAEDKTAAFEYRKSVDGVTWGEWQESATFDNLEPGTQYYFQARYKAVDKHYLDSTESNIIELSTITATLTAPELSAEGAVITANTIELAAVAASVQDTGAIVKYFLSADGQTWNDGQESPIFTGLDDNTKYYFKAQYISSNNNKYLDSADSNVIEISTELSAEAPTFVVGEVVGRAGKTVDVTVEIKNNPGIVSAAFDISYDRDKLELTGVSDGGLLPNFSKSQDFEIDPYHVNWEDSTAELNNTENGILVTFTFKVKDTCKSGDVAEIIINYDENNVYDVNMTNVKFHVVNGSVTVDDHNWSEITYTWSEDHLTCTASRTCTDGNCSEVETETAVASVDRTPSNCTVEGKNVYTATFENGAFEVQVYTENFGKLPHSYVIVSGADNAALVKKCSCTHTEEVTVDETTPVITIADVHSNNKDEIKVAVSVENNPGFKAMSFTLDFDRSKLQLVGAENKTTLTNLVSDGNVITIGGAEETANYTGNGDLVILTFKALADCENQPLTVTYNIADITNAAGEHVLFAIDNGKVTAANYTVGDVNGDGKVELKDVTYLRRHLASWDGYTDIVKFAGDVDGDGTVGQLDVAYLLRHVAEYEGYEELGRK